MTVEELRGMTQEDLVRRVQELEEANEKLAEEKKAWYKSWSDLQQKFEHFIFLFVLGVPSVRIVHLFLKKRMVSLSVRASCCATNWHD